MKIPAKPKIAYHISFIIIFISAIIIYAFSSHGNNQDNNSVCIEDDVPEAINMLLTNSLSDLNETKKLDDQIERFLRTWHIKGASLAIMKDEKLIYAKGYGWANEEDSTKFEVKHILRIASVSKLITAVGIMKLAEQGRLAMNSKVFGPNGILDTAMFPYYRDKRVKNITIENLLRHQGGFTNRRGDPMFNTTAIIRTLKLDTVPQSDDIIRYALSMNLGYTPGKGTRYSNLGYMILSRVIEKITDMDYETFIKEQVLAPAGCYDFHIAKNSYQDRYPNEAKYYEPENEEPITAFDGSGELKPRCYGGNNITSLYGAGAWVASPSELLKFVASIDGRDMQPDILSKESIEYMVKSGGSLLPIGWAKTYKSGDWSRTGTLSGTSALLKYQRDGYSWVFITNTSSWKGSHFPKQIDGFFRRALKKVSVWPDRNLFDLSSDSSKTQQ